MEAENGEVRVRARWWVRVSFAVLAMLVPLHVACDSPVHASPPSASVSTTIAGLTLTLSTRASAYPPDALAPVTVTLHNQSNESAAIEECAGFLPLVQMLDTAGQQVTEPAIPTGYTHRACFDPTPPVPLPAGRSLHWQGVLILRAPRLRALEPIYRAGDGFSTPESNLQTPILNLQRLPPHRTQANFVTSPHLHAIVQTPPGARVYYSDRVDCVNSSGGAIFGGSDGWTPANGTTIMPTAVDGCTRITRWRIAIAVQGLAPIWLDHRIPLPPLPAGKSISAPPCRSAPPRGVGATGAIWRGAVYIVAASGTHTCRLTGDVGASGAWLSPDGQWTAWFAPERNRHWIDDLWVGRTDRAVSPYRVPGATFSTPFRRVVWSAQGNRFAFARGSAIVVVQAGRKMQNRLTGGRLGEVAQPSWLPNASAVAVQTGPRGQWAHTFELTVEGIHGQVREVVVQFPPWLSNPHTRPIGSHVLSTMLASADGDHVFLATSGGGVQLSGIWEASLRASPAAAHLVIGTRARVQGRRPAPAAHLAGATHLFGSPDGRYLVVDPRGRFWVEDTRTLRGQFVHLPVAPGCVISQSAWMGDGRSIAFVQTCRLPDGTAFRSTLWSVGLNGKSPRRLLSAVDYHPDAIAIDTAYR